MARQNWWLVACLAVLCLLARQEVGMAEPSEIVLQTIAMESASEPMEGQVLVARTIQNRARKAGITPERAVLRPFQFSCWNDRKWAKRWLDTHYGPKTRLRALKAWEMASYSTFNGRHYHTTDVMPYWAKGHAPSVVVGRHAFYDRIR